MYTITILSLFPLVVRDMMHYPLSLHCCNHTRYCLGPGHFPHIPHSLRIPHYLLSGHIPRIRYCHLSGSRFQIHNSRGPARMRMYRKSEWEGERLSLVVRHEANYAD